MTNRVLLFIAALALVGCGETTTPQPSKALDVHSDSVKAWHPAADATKASPTPSPKPPVKKRPRWSIAGVVTDYAATQKSTPPSKTDSKP